MTSRSMLITLPIVGLALAACGGSDEAGGDATTTTILAGGGGSDAPETTEAPATTEVPATTEAPATTAGPETTAAPATTAAPETTAAPAGGDGECLIGSWVITDDELNAYYDAVAANVDTTGDLVFSITGQVTLDLDGATYVYGSAFELDLSVAGTSGTGVSTGGVSGTYSVADGIITTELGSSDLNVVVTVAGVTLNGSDLANGLLTDLPINNAPFDCAGPTISFQAGATADVRHDVLLTPA